MGVIAYDCKYIRKVIILREKLIRYMYGRYGMDSLGKFTIIAGLIVMLIAGWKNSFILSLVAWFCIIYAYFRMFLPEHPHLQSWEERVMGVEAPVPPRNQWCTLTYDHQTPELRTAHLHRLPKKKYEGPTRDNRRTRHSTNRRAPTPVHLP